ncbi:hypothetical protein Tco_0307950 [Tanacetum coccineum]
MEPATMEGSRRRLGSMHLGNVVPTLSGEIPKCVQGPTYNNMINWFLLTARVSCYTDDGYLTDADDLKSQTGYVFVLNKGVVDWKSAKQRIFATSSTKAEYIVAYDASKEAIWVRKFISGLGITKGARRFRAKVHYLCEVIEYDDVKLEKVHTDDNLADPFTKVLAFPKHSEHTKNIGMFPASSLM